jgi:hypothetical protein
MAEKSALLETEIAKKSSNLKEAAIQISSLKQSLQDASEKNAFKDGQVNTLKMLLRLYVVSFVTSHACELLVSLQIHVHYAARCSMLCPFQRQILDCNARLFDLGVNG